MDLRDKETEGHTRRVTELTLQLSRAMGISEAQIVHIRRGALLHDMGKLGIPDYILHKPGKLTDEGMGHHETAPAVRLRYAFLYRLPASCPGYPLLSPRKMGRYPDTRVD